ncbi:hypothetical protein [Catellatospora vulcania]|uniref:hypothetical protein n=1 Tax=Catellatospora vulcania TaxID=1460450 RepID=UPI0012D4711B|nr:hypothetical protein [Catellatospora vulcania]
MSTEAHNFWVVTTTQKLWASQRHGFLAGMFVACRGRSSPIVDRDLAEIGDRGPEEFEDETDLRVALLFSLAASGRKGTFYNAWR